MQTFTLKTFCATVFALFAFAGNSVLCRLALGNGEIDATSFTIIRLVSGALGFVGILWLAKQIGANQYLFSASDLRNYARSKRHKWLGAGLLFIYAACFSYAYIALDTGVGALVLFGTVQLSMIVVSVYKGEYLPLHHILGIAIAFGGLCFLIYVEFDWQTARLSALGFVFMVIAGIAWGAYTLVGKSTIAPFIDTQSNFSISVIFCLPLLVVYIFMPAALSTQGFWLAVISGIITSALGYTIWYIALRALSSVQAGVVQLLVPIIAAIGGIIWVGEPISSVLFISQAMVLGGIAMVMIKAKPVKATS